MGQSKNEENLGDKKDTVFPCKYKTKLIYTFPLYCSPIGNLIRTQGLSTKAH